MKALLLLMIRISTGLLLVLWGVIKVGSPDQAVAVAERYYNGMLGDLSLQPILGFAEIALGVLVCLATTEVLHIMLPSGMKERWSSIAWQLTPTTSCSSPRLIHF